jgi:hypothetical protein
MIPETKIKNGTTDIIHSMNESRKDYGKLRKETIMGMFIRGYIIYLVQVVNSLQFIMVYSLVTRLIIPGYRIYARIREIMFIFIRLNIMFMQVEKIFLATRAMHLAFGQNIIRYMTT